MEATVVRAIVVSFIDVGWLHESFIYGALARCYLSLCGAVTHEQVIVWGVAMGNEESVINSCIKSAKQVLHIRRRIAHYSC